MIKIKCIVCRREISNPNLRQKTCSHKCSIIYRKAYRKTAEWRVKRKTYYQRPKVKAYYKTHYQRRKNENNIQKNRESNL